MSEPKELNFFVESKNWPRGVEWYKTHFDATAAVRGESSPDYADASLFPGVPARMAQVVPQAKLILIVRDPIERLISHYMHNFIKGYEHRDLAQVVRDRHYLERSMYWFQISKYLDHFDTSQLLILENDELRHDRRDAMRRVFEFVGVDPKLQGSYFQNEYNRSAHKRRKTRLGFRLERSALGRCIQRLPRPWRSRVVRRLYFPLSRPIEYAKPSEHELAELVHSLRDDSAQFRAWTGCDFPSWSV